MAQNLQDLLTVDAGAPEEIYERLVEAVVERSGGGFGVFFRIAEVEGSRYYDGFRLSGATNAEESRINAIIEHPILEGPTIKFRQPDPDEISTFVDMRNTSTFEGSEIREGYLDPLSIHSWIRIHVYHGDQFVGHLGCYHRGDDPRCDSQMRRDFERLNAPICAALANAEVLRRAQFPDDDACVLINPEGEVECATSAAAPMLSADRRDGLRRATRRLDAGDVEQCVGAFDGVEGRITRMEGGGMLRYVARLTPIAPVTVDPLCRLTPAQRRVAEYAAAGATAAEIAETLQLSVHTVRTHIRNIYRRLQISSRIELVELMETGRQLCIPHLQYG